MSKDKDDESWAAIMAARYRKKLAEEQRQRDHVEWLHHQDKE